ncbi:hypothetical protein LCGC14_2144830, partial [marine sediment metagenome]
MRDNFRQLGIPGTSYSLQLVSNNGKVVLHILKGTDVIDSLILKDEDVEDGIPKLNLLVGWVLRTLPTPNINPHLIMRTAQALVRLVFKKKSGYNVKVPLPFTLPRSLEKLINFKVEQFRTLENSIAIKEE